MTLPRWTTGLLLPLAVGVSFAQMPAFSSILAANLSGDSVPPQIPLLERLFQNKSSVTRQGSAQAAPGVNFKLLHTFEGEDRKDGALPFAKLTLDTAGDLYGTTSQGGQINNKGTNNGTVFKITTGGKLTLQHSFNDEKGLSPFAGVTFIGTNQLFGTTYQGGKDGRGTVFRLTPKANGNFQKIAVLHDFDDRDGAFPFAGLAVSSSGVLYGTTTSGGAQRFGTVFKITTGGKLTTLRSFRSRDGVRPYGGVVLDGQGNLYGTNYLGGAGNKGTLFKLTPNGSLKSLYSFRGSDGSYPFAGLTLDSAGNAYGTTCNGGANDKGVVFRWSSTGKFTRLYSFKGSDGNCPYAGVTLDAAGNLYGTTYEGGHRDNGTVFRLTPGGKLTRLYSFGGAADGANPRGEVILDKKGNLYGTARFGGKVGNKDTDLGTVFKLSLN